jgi:serine/threonine protein kinase
MQIIFVCADVLPLVLFRRSVQGQGPMGRPKITTGLDKVRKEIDLMKLLWHRNILVLHEVIDDPDEDPLILVLEYAAKGQIMAFDSKTMKYKRNLFDGTPGGGGSSPAQSPAAASSSSASQEHERPIKESILRKILDDVLSGLEYRQSNEREWHQRSGLSLRQAARL